MTCYLFTSADNLQQDNKIPEQFDLKKKPPKNQKTKTKKTQTQF